MARKQFKWLIMNNKMTSSLRLFAAVTAIALLAPVADAAAPKARFLKDESPAVDETPYVQTAPQVVDAMLKIAGVRGTDFIIDLGSGDGRIPITAAKMFGARGFGVEHDPRLVDASNARAKREGVGDRVSFVKQDLFMTDLSPATVVSMYLLPDNNLALRPRILKMLRPGARVVSHDYDMGDWKPDVEMKVPVPDKPVGVEKASKVFLWIIPARMEGTWKFAQPRPDGGVSQVELAFKQQFQELSGVARVDGREVPIERAFLQGMYLSFRITDGANTFRYQGYATTGHIKGEVANGSRTAPWRAVKAGGG